MRKLLIKKLLSKKFYLNILRIIIIKFSVLNFIKYQNLKLIFNIKKSNFLS